MLRIHISAHNDDLHNTTAKRNLPGGVVGLQADSKIDVDYLHDHLLTVAEFQTNPGTGTASNPERLNDNAINNLSFDTTIKYVQILFDDYAVIKEFRHYGSALNNGDGKLTIQHLWGTTWVDNTIDISTRNPTSWTAWTPLTTIVITKGIRMFSPVMDSGFNESHIQELEIRG